MSDPISTPTATATATTLALASMFPGVPAGIILGAFAGAALFVITANDFCWWQKILLFFASFAAGFIAAPATASLLVWALPINHVDNGVGALVASAVIVRVLLFVTARLNDPSSLVPFLTKKGSKE